MRVDIVSGRPRQPLERWFGACPIALWAEHGFWHRAAPGRAWETVAGAEFDWQDRVHPLLEQFVASTPGSHIETKTASLAWHFRNAQREHGLRQAHELRMLLGTVFSNQPWIVTEGKKVIEVRLRAADKAIVGARVSAETGPDTTLITIGDEVTDDDLFRALPPTCVKVAVGRPSRHAPHHLMDYRDVRKLLVELLEARPAHLALG
jgi:trehalose 6-phosphate synthase/phosphatase